MNISDQMYQTLMLVVPMGLIFYFLLWRPQQQRTKELRRMVDDLHRGDTVITSGGIVGKIVKASAADDPEILVEIADNVQVRVLKTSLTDVRGKTQPVEAKS
jgi:preprotein translocase subunit YajC